MTLGTDISDAQTLTDAGAYKASGRAFCVVKLGEGMNGPGSNVGADKSPDAVAALRAAGVDVAGYWFVHPDVSGEAQGHLAASIAKSLGLASVACDCEVQDGQDWNAVASAMHGFLGAIVGAGLGTMIYDNETWVDALGAESWGEPIWYANPSVLYPNRGCVLWQCGQGSVPGISGTVDLDNWVGAPAAYDAFFGKALVAPITTKELSMFTTDPTTGGTWSTDAAGDVFAEFGAPAIPGLNTHPEWHAGSAESGNSNPVVGLTAVKDANGEWGLCFFTFDWTKAPDGSPYHGYRINRDGSPG